MWHCAAHWSTIRAINLQEVVKWKLKIALYHILSEWGQICNHMKCHSSRFWEYEICNDLSAWHHTCAQCETFHKYIIAHKDVFLGKAIDFALQGHKDFWYGTPDPTMRRSTFYKEMLSVQWHKSVFCSHLQIYCHVLFFAISFFTYWIKHFVSHSP